LYIYFFFHHLLIITHTLTIAHLLLLDNKIVAISSNFTAYFLINYYTKDGPINRSDRDIFKYHDQDKKRHDACLFIKNSVTCLNK